MKIAQIAPLAESVPPTLYGGTERVVSWLTEELVAQGHEVTLFASGDSRTDAELVAVTPKALRLNPDVRDGTPYHLILLDRVIRRAQEFDVLHFHIDMMHYPLFRSLADRVLTTLHGRLDLPDLHPFYRAFPNMALTSISNDQRKPMPPVNWQATVQHGLPANLHRANMEPGKYLAFLGRISPEKGPEDAIAIAIQAGLPLKIAAKVDNADRVYFEARVKPLLAHPLIEYIGEIDEAHKSEFLGNAMALLFPIHWPEPFGLVMIEAMACGTPTIAYRRGSVPEVLEDGLTGFIVSDVAEAAAAIARIPELDRGKIRARFESRFTSQVMVQNYLNIYERMIERRAETSEAA
ncbi:MAG TPA: glycosyltransferase family 4 protein [Rhizomicrobium sp.]|nr:glycosyltransferase family 4 protein [Rhizomicrobium sp.]